MKKKILIILTFFTLLPTTLVFAQTDSELSYNQTIDLLTEFTQDADLENLSDYALISTIVNLIDHGIEAIAQLDDKQENRDNWIDELEKEGLVRIKTLLLDDSFLGATPATTFPVENAVGDIPREWKNALGSAESYLNYMSFSKEGLYDQLLYEEYPEDAIQYAVDNIITDWNENALQSALNYLDFMSFSDAGLYDQLIYEGYTPEQAQYAIDNLD